MRLILFLPFFGLVLACDSRNGQVCMEASRRQMTEILFQIVNKCSFPIWPGIFGQQHTPSPSGFKLNSGESRDIFVPDGWVAGRIWARTGCDGKFNCETGGCGPEENCNRRTGEPPASLAEFTLNGHGNQDYYDISLVDGFNIPVAIYPVEGTYENGAGEYYCKRAGNCNKNMNEICPQELKKVVNGKTVGCKSACLAMNTDEYCCRGRFGQPETCKSSHWPKNYPAIFKGACPTAYSYAYDDHKSTFTCKGKGTKSPVYTIQFC